LYFIDVILPIPLKQTFTYSVNKDEAYFLKRGMRVAVPFGKSKIYTAVVYSVHKETPYGYQTKSIDQILDETPLITETQLKHWEWLSSYYMCFLGEVIRAALPSPFLLESDTVILRSNTQDENEISFTNDEFLVYTALKNHSLLHIDDVRSILARKNVVGVINNLLTKGVVQVKEEVYEKYQPKRKRCVKLSQNYSNEKELKELLETMSRSPKQRLVLMNLFMLSASEENVETILLQKKSQTTSTTINALIAKGVL